MHCKKTPFSKYKEGIGYCMAVGELQLQYATSVLLILLLEGSAISQIAYCFS